MFWGEGWQQRDAPRRCAIRIRVDQLRLEQDLQVGPIREFRRHADVRAGPVGWVIGRRLLPAGLKQTSDREWTDFRLSDEIVADADAIIKLCVATPDRRDLVGVLRLACIHSALSSVQPTRQQVGGNDVRTKCVDHGGRGDEQPSAEYNCEYSQ